MNSDDPNWLQTFAEGGLPQVLAGPAGKAISRLVGATVEIPATWLEGIAQGTRDKTEARTAISKALATKVAEQAIDNPEAIDRAMKSMLGRAYRSQVNKEAVAKAAIEDLKTNPDVEDKIGPSDDWMTKFERYAEDAVDDDMRTMFGRLLAGEVRKPGTIAPTSLHFVSMLEKDVAEIIQRVLPHTFDEGVTILDCLQPELSVVEISYLEQSGFWSAEKSFSLSSSENDRIIRMIRGSMGVVIQTNDTKTVKFRAALLSRAGRDLLKVVNTPFDFERLGRVLKSKETPHYGYGEMYVEGDRIIMPQPKMLF